MNTNNELLKGFFELDRDYRPAAMWFWNDVLVESELTAQMESFKEQGIIDFFVNHVWGATDEYLGERYFEMVRYVLEEAKRLDLHFWIYDEFNWPSGVAGGLVIKNHPETKAKMIQDDKIQLFPREKLIKKYIDGKFESASFVWRTSPQDGATDVSDKVTVEQAENGFWISYENDSCDTIYLHVISVQLQNRIVPACQWGKYSTEEYGFVDNFDERAIRLFMDYTHEKYKEVIGDEFGKTVKGIFTDEICVSSHLDMSGKRVPWNDAFKDNFRKKYGYDITPFLHVLAAKAYTPQEKKARFDYWRLATELATNNHLKQVRAWCDKENLLYTGHLCLEESLICTMYQSGDIFDMLEVMSLPGIDTIFSRDWIEDEDFDLAGKTIGSVSRFFNRDRTLCETYTISTNKLRFDEMQRIANRVLVLGANMIQYMGAGYANHNGRRYDWLTDNPNGGPSFGDNNTIFEHLGKFSDYVSRIQYISAKTKPAGKVLLMSNQAGVFANYDGQAEMRRAYAQRYKREDGRFDANRNSLVTALLELNIEYDLFGDNMADRMTAENGVATLCGGKYDTVILPNVGDTPRKVYDMIDRLRKAGVKIIFADELPELVLDEAVYEAPLGKAPESEGITMLEDNVYFLRVSDVESKRCGKNCRYKELLEEVVGKGRRTLDIKHNGNIYTGLRKREDTTVVLMCNDANEEREASIIYNEGMLLLDPATGNKVELNGIGGRSDIHFDAHQMYILVDGAEAAESKVDKRAGETILQLAPECEIELEKGNVMTVEWQFAPYDTDGESLKVADELMPLVRDSLPGKYAEMNAKGLLVFDFEVEHLPETALFIVDSADIFRCEVNGVRVDDVWKPYRFWGPRNHAVDIAAQLKLGKNRLVVANKVPDYNIPYKAAFGLIRGDFEICGKTMLKRRSSYVAAPVNGQGCMDFCGSANYRFTAELTAEEVAEAAFVSVETRDATELFVNGVSAGVRLWAPHSFNVEGMLKEGRNELVFRSTVPMWNMLCECGEEMDIGLLGAPRIEKKR
ncbi:MAG: hypothetical protein IJF27_07345 [Oscillospiraceae bacterium]|nr:hypothetical protein [Oscillospiraceae bacterium]